MENGLVYGLPMQRLLTLFDRDSQSWRTSERSLFVDYQTFLDRWPKSGILRNGRVYEQATLAHPTNANGCGSWPTPTANDAKNNTFPKSQLEWGPVVGAVMRRWPTPRACDERHGKNINPNDKRSGLPAAVLFPTSAGNGGCLNPDWVEWLMGYPIGWTDTDTEPAAVIGWEADPADSGDIPRVRDRRQNDRKRLHALGNAIVPQVAELVWEMIRSANSGRVEDE